MFSYIKRLRLSLNAFTNNIVTNPLRIKMASENLVSNAQLLIFLNAIYGQLDKGNPDYDY